MKLFYRLALLVFLCGFTGLAGASPLDFKTNVLDPTATSFPTFPIQTLTFPVVFTGCAAGELPGNNKGDGCFAGVNRTGVDWTSIEFAFPNTSALGSQPVACNTASSETIFSGSSCGLDPTSGKYFLDFSNGVLRNGAIFFVTEQGVDASKFPPGTATVTSYVTTTPEPTSLLLLSTGLLGFALVSVKAGRG